MAQLSHLHHIYAALGLLSYYFRVPDMTILHVCNMKDMVCQSRHASNIKLPINMFSRHFLHTSWLESL